MNGFIVWHQYIDDIYTSILRFSASHCLSWTGNKGVINSGFLKLATEENMVIINDINTELTAKAAREINKLRDTSNFIPGDASDPEIIKRMVDTAFEIYGKSIYYSLTQGSLYLEIFLSIPVILFSQYQDQFGRRIFFARD